MRNHYARGDMKKIIVNSKPVYICDPKKNINCRKTMCQEACFMTFDKECAAFDLMPHRYGAIGREVEE